MPWNRSPRAGWRGLLLATALACLAGCGDGRKTPYPVHGQVFDAKKRPAVGAIVTFHPATPDPKDPLRPTGKVDEQGNFSLTTQVEGDGAPAGEYTITVVWPAPRKSPFEPDTGDQLKGKLDRPEKSQLKFKVESAPNNAVPAITLP